MRAITTVSGMEVPTIMASEPSTTEMISRTIERFRQVANLVEGSPWKQAIAVGHRHFNIKQYSIDKLTPRKVQVLYEQLANKHYSSEKLKPTWYENQLRIYIWLLVTYSGLVEKPPGQFVRVQLTQTAENWQFLVSFFHGKSSFLCEFQYRNICRASERVDPWTKAEDELLRESMTYLRYYRRQEDKRGHWNQLAKELFLRSNKRYFRSAKQCRERWNNYLDPTKKRESWTNDEDLALVRGVIESGKKWSHIAKLLEQERTEHTVKNRYKSLLSRYYRSIPKSRQRYLSEHQVLLNLEKELLAELSKQHPSKDTKSSQSTVQTVMVPQKAVEQNIAPLPKMQPVRTQSAFSKLSHQSRLQTPHVEVTGPIATLSRDSSYQMFGFDSAYTPAIGFNTPLPPVALTPFELSSAFYNLGNHFGFDKLRR